MWKNEWIDCYRNESELVDLIADLEIKKREFDQRISGLTYRGSPYKSGGMRPEVSMRLYGLVRKFKPATLVETGVCNGVSTAVILAALAKNRSGLLYSIDFPEYTDTPYQAGTFWEGKMGAVVPKDKPPGWIIPLAYRGRWQLSLGRSQEILPALLARLGEIDFFLHDSEHSYECMYFEYEQAWKHLKPEGLLVSDDISWNTAFMDFARSQAKKTNSMDRNMAFISK